MLRLLALTLAFATVAGVGATGPLRLNEGKALSNPQSTLLRGLTPADLKALIADIDAQGLNTSGSTNVKTGVGRMQIAAGKLPKLGLVGSIGTVATGSVIVWKVADALGLGGYVYKKITGQAYPTAVTSPITWQSVCASGCFATAVSVLTGGVLPGPSEYWYLRNVANGHQYCAVVLDCWSTGAWREFATAALTLTGTQSQYSTPASACQTDGAGGCVYKWRTNAQMESSIAIAPATQALFDTPPAGATTVTAGTADSTISDPELAAALDAIDPVPGTTGTAVEQETAEAILDELDPGWEVGTAITLLQPMPNETYTDYITRLQESGYVGTATSTVLTTAAEDIGPLAVARLTWTYGSTTRTLSPLAWPTVAPTILPNAALAIRYNPSTAAPAPTEGTSTSVTVTIPPTTVPPPVDIDFTPITDLDGECSFPFGFICYAQEVTAEFDVTAEAPVFAFDIDVPDLMGGGTVAYEVDLDVMDDYMVLLRGIISFVLWVGGVYWLAVNLLGFRGGGDPSEAADEALHV